MTMEERDQAIAGLILITKQRDQLSAGLSFARLQFIALQKKSTMRGVHKRELEIDAHAGERAIDLVFEVIEGL